MNIDLPLPADETIAPQFSHDLDEPVDQASTWPDLRHRSLTADERAALLQKAALIHQAVEHFDTRLQVEEELRRAEPALLAGEAKPPYLPGMMVSLIFVPLHAAQRDLEARRDDEAAVAYLRNAEVLARLLFTWRDPIWEERIEALIGSTLSLTVAMPKEGSFISTSLSVEA